MSKKSPIQIVKDKFGSKESLIAKLVDLLETQDGESKEEMAKRLKHVANAKLLHLLAVGTKVSELGGKAKLVEQVAKLKGQSKDSDFVEKLKSYSLSKLLDLHGSLNRKAAQAG